MCCWKMVRFFDWIGRVIIGWWNVITKNETSEAKRRYDICMECEDRMKIGRKGGICSICGCPIISKTRSPKEKCLKDKW